MHKKHQIAAIVSFLTMSNFNLLRIATANELACPEALTASQRKQLIHNYLEQISSAKVEVQKHCKNPQRASMDNESIDNIFIGLKAATAVGALAADKFGFSIKALIVIFSEVGLEALKFYTKAKYGTDNKLCTKAQQVKIRKEYEYIENRLKKGKIRDIDLIEICKDSLTLTPREKKEYIKDILGVPSDESPDTDTVTRPIISLPPHTTPPSTIKPENRLSDWVPSSVPSNTVTRPVVPLPPPIMPTPTVRREITSIDWAPNHVRNTGWDHYCKGGGHDYCEFLIYAGKAAYTEKYTAKIGSYRIQKAYLRIRSVLDDAPSNPNITNYELIVTINGYRVPEQLKLTKAAHGTPLGGPFDNFSDETLELPEVSYQYFADGDNEISYQLAAPVGAWIVFKESALVINAIEFQ
jgi:hypothetical protein